MGFYAGWWCVEGWVYTINSYFHHMVTHRARWSPSADDSARGWTKSKTSLQSRFRISGKFCVNWYYINKHCVKITLEGSTWTSTNQAIPKIWFESIPCQCQTVAKPIRDCLTTLAKFKVRWCWRKKNKSKSIIIMHIQRSVNFHAHTQSHTCSDIVKSVGGWSQRTIAFYDTPGNDQVQG